MPGSVGWAIARPPKRLSMAIIAIRNLFIVFTGLKVALNANRGCTRQSQTSLSLHSLAHDFINYVSSHDVLVIDHKGLMATTFFLSNLDNELLIVWDCEFLQSKHGVFRRFTMHNCYIILSAERFYNLLLHGSSA